MASRVVIKAVPSWNNLLRVLALTGLLSSGLLLPRLEAKEPVLVTIELYDGSSGAAYLQISGLLLNGKTEVRECAPGQSSTIDKSTYGKMARLNLAAGGVLERGEDGVLRYTSGGAAPICVLPVNLKFEHSSSYTLSSLAEQSDLKGTAIGPASDGVTGIPALKKGVKLVFVATPNVEYAEFLRAQRASAIADWQTYLSKYPSTSHTGDAKQSLALLFVAAGEKSLSAYDRSANTNTPSWVDLKEAKGDADQARALVPALDGSANLVDKVRAKLTALTLAGRGELNAYRDALNGHTKGYTHLVAAQKLSDGVAGVDPQFQPGLDLFAEVGNAVRAFDKALKTAEDAVAKKQMDAAIVAVEPYRSFATEEPRTTAVLDAVYGFHMGLGSKAGLAQDWVTAVTEYEKADATEDTLEAKDALKNAREQKTILLDTNAARAAVEKSKELEQEHEIIEAYETLAALSAPQQKLAAEQMELLKQPYVQAAVQRAKDLKKNHTPIGGNGDGFEMENAYNYLKRANELIPDQAYEDLMISIADSISSYFLSQADHYLAKAEGSGTEVAWAYLQEALAYKASNQTEVRDRRTKILQAHAMHSKLSILVHFRDGTSAKDSSGFATELDNKTITGLESSNLPVKAYREGETTVVKPDFELIGDVTQHHVYETSTSETLKSRFYANSTTVSNEAWVKANRDYESLNQDLSSARTEHQTAIAKGNKKLIAETQDKVSGLEKKAQAARLAMDSIPRDQSVADIQDYNYTKKTIDYKAVIELQFRLGDTLSGHRFDSVPIAQTHHTQVVILEGVKAEDRGGVKPSGTVPEINELLSELGTVVRPELIDAVLKQVKALPQTIYDAAKKNENDGDFDGAAEGYLRYLYCAPKEQADQISHVLAFLSSDQFHLRPDSASTP